MAALRRDVRQHWADLAGWPLHHRELAARFPYSDDWSEGSGDWQSAYLGDSRRHPAGHLASANYRRMAGHHWVD